MDKQPSDGILEEFRIEFLECWHRLPNKGFFLTLLVAWVAMFHFVGNATLGYINTPSLLSWMYQAYNPPGESLDADDAHGNLIPFLVLILFWWKRKELLALELRSWWPALLLVGLGILIHIIGFGVQQSRVSIVGLFIGLYGLMGLAWGPAFLRASFFPFWLFVFSVPLGTLGQMVTFPLRILVAKIVTAIAHLGLAPDLVRDGTKLMDSLSSFQYDIAPACSGIRSLVSLLALTVFYAYGVAPFRATWKRLALIAAAVPLAVVGNVARLTLTVAVAEAWGQEWGSKVETNLGFVTFAVAGGLVLLLGHWLRDKEPQPGAAPAQAQEAKTP